MKFVKWTLAAVALIITLFFGAIVLITTAIDPNDYTDDISTLIKKETSLDVSLGELDWSFFPWLGISIANIALSHPDAGDLANIAEIQARLKVMPLLQKKVEVGSLRVVKADVIVIANKDGSLNWDVLSAASDEAPAQTSTADSQTEAAPLPFDISVSEVSITDTSVRYTDNAAGATYLINDFNLSAQNIVLGQSFPISMDFVADLGDGMTVQQDLTATALVDLDQQRYELSQLKARTIATAQSIFPSPLTVNTTANIKADLTADTAQVSELAVEVEGMRFLATIDVKQLSQELSASGSLSIPEFNPKALLEKLAVELPPMNDAKALSNVSFSSKLSANLMQATLSDIILKVDAIIIAGELGVKDLDTQALFAKLSIDEIMLDNYLAPTSEDDEVSQESADSSNTNPNSATAALEPLIPVDTIKDLNLEAQLTIKKLVVESIPITSIKALVSARNGVVKLSDFSGQVLDGSFLLTTVLNVNGAQPTIKVSNQLTKIQLGPLVKTFAESDVFSGEINFTGNIFTQGNSIDAFTANLSGLNDFTMSEGLIKGLNITELVFEKLGALGPLAQSYLTDENKAKAPPAFQKDSRIGNLVAIVEINNGIAKTKTLSADLEKASTTGFAEVNLIEETLKLDLNLKLDESISNAYLASVIWPVTCTGSLAAAPDCKVNSSQAKKEIEKLAKDAAKKKAKAKIAEQLGLDTQGKSVDDALAEELARKKEDEKRRLKEKEDELKQKAKDKINEKLNKLFR